MKREFLKWLIFVGVVTCLQFFYVYVFFIEPNWIKTEHVTIVNAKLSKALSGLRVIQLSDLHIESLGKREIYLIEKINKLKPDVILITGDMLGDQASINALFNTLSLLEPKFHTYAVSGESDGALSEIKDSQQWNRASASIIDGKAIHLNPGNVAGTGFWLIGAPSDQELTPLISTLSKDEPTILMSHHPDIVKQAAIKGIDLVLAGHTHGGQVGIPLLRRLFPYTQRSNYISGLYRVRNTLLYVNRGLASKKEIRFLCRPEITVFEFVATGKAKTPKVLEQDTY